MKNIPLEIWSLVAEVLSAGDVHPMDEDHKLWNRVYYTRRHLTSMRLVSHMFCQAATPFIVRASQVRLQLFPPFEELEAPTFWLLKLRWLRTVGISRHIRTLRITIPQRKHDGYGPFPCFEEINGEILNLIRSCTELQRIELRFASDASSHPVLGKAITMLGANALKLNSLFLDIGDNRLSGWTDLVNDAISDFPQGGLNYSRLLSRLRYLHYHYDIRLCHLAEKGARYPAHFDPFLEAAKRLEYLRIESRDPQQDLDLHRLINSGSQNLRQISLWRVRISQPEFLEFTQSYLHSLEEISLDTVFLSSGSWRDLFLGLCAIQLRRFTSISLYYARDFTNDEMYDYYYVTEVTLPSQGCKRSEYVIKATVGIEDFYALGHLQRHVNRIRCQKALDPIEDTFRGSDFATDKSYKFMCLPRLENIDG